MKNNRIYFKKLPQVFLFMLVIVGVYIFTQPQWKNDHFEESSKWLLYLNYFLFSSGLLIALGYALDKWKAALVAIAACIAIGLLDILVLSKYRLDDESREPRVLLIIATNLLYHLPYFVFFLVQKFPVRKLLMLCLILIASRGFVNVYSVQPAYELLNKMFHTEILSDRSGNFIVCLAHQLFLFLFYCEIQNYLSGKAEEKNTTLLNPANEYGKVAGIIGFWTVKTFAYAIIIGSVNVLQSLRHHFSLWEAGTTNFFYYQSIVQTMLCLGAILFCGWYLRKLMLEFLITYQVTSRFVYWLLLLPVIGFVTLLIISLTAEKNKTIAAKINGINSFAASESRGVTVIVVIGMVLQLIYVMSNTRSAAPLFFLAIDAGIFLWMIANKQGYQFTLWLRIICFATLIAVIFVDRPKSETIFYVSFLYPFLLMSIFQVVLIFPVYHFDTFGYVSDGAEVPPADVSGDQLAEFDMTVAK